MKAFQVGDRVAFYYEERYVGIITGISGDGKICQIKTTDGKSYFNIVHTKQCRHLKKRELRRVWVFFDKVGNTVGPVKHDPGTPGYVEFIEVRKKK